MIAGAAVVKKSRTPSTCARVCGVLGASARPTSAPGPKSGNRCECVHSQLEARNDSSSEIVSLDSHDLDHVERHRTFRIRCVICSRCGFAAASVAAKISTDDREVTSEPRRQSMPHRVSLRKPVQQQQRGACPSATNEDPCRCGVDRLRYEPVEHLANLRTF